MNFPEPETPRILILERDRATRSVLRRYALELSGATSVQANDASLDSVAAQPAVLEGFDIVFAGCDFAADGSSTDPNLIALRTITARPAAPPVVLVTFAGSEYTAVRALQGGAFDYLPRQYISREPLRAVVERAMRAGAAGRRDGRADRRGDRRGTHRGDRRGTHRGDRPGTHRADATDAVNGPCLPGYELRRELARRDNVSVHVAYSAERGDEVVVKWLSRARGRLARDYHFTQLVEEFQLLYALDDPAVAEIHDFRVTRRYCHIAMEYFRGGSLSSRLAEPREVPVTLGWAREIAKALAIVHGAGIVHRDLKPGNVMFREDGSLALIDFGIASSTYGVGHDGELIAGTPYYMSPEQAAGTRADERTDLYALGVILYQMLTGEKPYHGRTSAEILDAHCCAPVPRLPASLAALQPAIDRLMAKAPEKRAATAREAVEVLDAACADFAAYSSAEQSS